MAEYLWYVLLNEKQCGPYTFLELKGIKAITPDTLCWREGMPEWVPIRRVPELKDLFKDENVLPTVPDEIPIVTPADDLALTLPQAEPPYYLWFILLFIVIAYALFQIYSNFN